MKILIATMKMGIGGAETHIIELCRALVSHRHSVTVASAGGCLAAELKKIGVTHVTLPLNKKDPISLLRSRRALKRLIGDEKFNIVHAHARIPAFVCEPICRKLDVRFVTTAHYDFKVNAVLKLLTRWGEHTFAVSEDISRYLEKNYRIERRNISLVPNGIDIEKFARNDDIGANVRRSLGARGKKLVVHVSRLDRAVSHCAEEFIGAADKISSEREDVMFVVVGGGDAFDEMKEKADRVNERRGRRVIWLTGAVSDVRPYLFAADVFVGPSRAALEAMASGLPVVISGSEGHLGELTRENYDYALETNLCCRSSELPTAAALCGCITDMLGKSAADIRALILLQNELLGNYTVEKMTDIYEREYARISKIKTKTRPAAVICGYYGYGNAGDRAMMFALVEGLRRSREAAPLCIMSARPRKTARECVCDSVHRYDIFAVRRRIKEAGVLIFGGGNLLQDQTSRRSLWYYLFIIGMAKRLGAKVIVYANGIGPLGKNSVASVTRALSAADYVSLRDAASYNFCVSHGIKATLSADPAFLLETGALPDTRGGYFVVVPRKTRAEDFWALCALTRWASEKYSLRPLVISMYPSQDGSVARALAKATDALIIEEGVTDFGILYSALAGAEFVIGARLHSLVCAAVAGCPPIAARNEKNAAFMKGLRLEYCYLQSFYNGRDVIEKVMQNPEIVRRSLTAASWKLRTLAEKDMENVVNLIFG
ncbi:MAG: polysaccharide pyruvyl transferase CsaB [Clostridia bacterium]|nr:polysaccharide pyruvyl transferase CsaB [Clostridia bacterium]